MIDWLRYKCGDGYNIVSGYEIQFVLKTESDTDILTIIKEVTCSPTRRVLTDDIEYWRFDKDERERSKEELKKKAKEILEEYRNKEKVVNKEHGVCFSGKQIIVCDFSIENVYSKKETFEEWKVNKNDERKRIRTV